MSCALLSLPSAPRLTSCVLITIAAVPDAAGRAGRSSRARPAAAEAATLLSQGKTATASSVENGLVPGVRGRGRQHRHPLVQRLQLTRSGWRWTSARPRRSARSSWTGRPPTPPRSRSRPRPTTRLDHHLLHHHRHRRHPDPQRHRHRPLLRMYGTARATQYGYSLWEFQVYGTRAARAPSCSTTDAALNQPATASSLENASFPASAAVDGNTGTRWSSAFTRPAVAARSISGSSQTDLRGDAGLGGGLRDRVPDPGLLRRHELDHDLLHHHRDRRHPDPDGVRHRPLRPDVRHRPRHPVRLLAVGVRRVHHRPGTGPTPTPTPTTTGSAGAPASRPPRSGATPAPSRPPPTCSSSPS